MNKSSLGMSFSFIFFVCLTMSGCATAPEITKLNGVWKYDKYSGGVLDQVMVVGKPRKDNVRFEFEDHVAKALKKRNIDAIPSYTVIPAMNDLNRESVKNAAVADGIKTVLVTKVVGVDEKDVIFRQSVQYDTIVTPYGVAMRPYLDGPKTVHYTKVRLESGLFEVQSEKLIWAATSAIMNPDSADEAIKDFTKAIIQQLMKDGYIL